MAASIADAGRSGKVLKQLDQKTIERICQQQDYHYRQLKLPPAQTVECFAWQVLMGNVTCDAVRHRERGTFSASAYCQARQRLPLGVLRELSAGVVARTLGAAGGGVVGGNGGGDDRHRWRGHRVFRVDGSGVSLPDSKEVREYFGCSGRQKPGCGYPTMHLLLLTGPAGVAVEAICSPLRTGDMTHAARTHGHLRAGDLLLGDGQFGGWGHLHQLQSQQLHGLFPAHHSRQVRWGRHAEHGPNRRFVRTLGWRDQLVEYRKPDRRPKWMTPGQFRQAPKWMPVREIGREVKAGGGRRKVVLVTTLLDSKKYPARQLAKLPGERWTIETDLRWLKTTMGMERLRCQTVDGVRKELLMYLIVYNLVRLLMLEASRRQRVPLDRVSFADALARLRYGGGDDDDGGWVELEVIPWRPGRIEPRVVKRRPKPFATMSKPRAQLRRLLRAKRAAA